MPLAQRRSSDLAGLIAIVSILALGACSPEGLPLSDEALDGYWSGSYEVIGQTVDLVIAMSGSETDLVDATVSMTERGVVDMPASDVSHEGTTLRLEFPGLGAYEGRLVEPGELRGDWLQAGARFRLELTQVDEPSGPNRPQEPRPPFPYDVTNVSFTNDEGGHRLSGTLTVPQAGLPAPAVVLVSGSGPQDRDETIFGHKPFWVIADHLSRAGIAVLRYDDRGVGESTGDFSMATTADHASDAVAAVTFLTTRPDIDTRNMGIVGHSEGGWVGPIAATRSDDISFLVLLAGVGMAGKDLLTMQMERILEASGTPGPLMALNRELQDRMLTALLEADFESVGAETLQEQFEEMLGGLPFRAAQSLGIAGRINQAIEAQMAAVASPWLRFFLTFDASGTLERVSVPVLALNGTLDLQVPHDPNLRLIAEALGRGGNRDVTTVELEGLNHMFQVSETGLPSEYGTIEQTIDPEVLRIMTEWIERVTGLARSP